MYMAYNNSSWNVLNNHSNGNISLNSLGNDVFIGWYNTAKIHLYWSNSDNTSRTEFLQVNSNGAYALTRFGVNGQNTSYNLYVNGTGYFDGNVTNKGTVYFNNGTSYYINNNAVARLNYIEVLSAGGLTINPAASPWPYINFSTRASASDATYVTATASTWVQIYATVPAKRTSDNSYYSSRIFFRFYSKTANTLTRIAHYEDYCLPYVNDGRTTDVTYNILTTKSAVTTAQGGTGNTSYTASRLIYSSSASKLSSSSIITDGAYISTSRFLATSETDAVSGSNAAVALTTGNASGTHMEFDGNEILAKTSASAKGTLYLNESGYVTADGKIYNAVWNDFAEYRSSNITEPGRVVVSDGKGNLILSTKRLQPCGHVISDTFGMAVGESDTAQTPLGVAGRILVIPYQDCNNYHIGDCLCTAPNGTADIMTREEIINYPDRIIGIVDEIPTYDNWEQTSTMKKHKINTTIPVNGRIWIYVK